MLPEVVLDVLPFNDGLLYNFVALMQRSGSSLKFFNDLG